VATAASLIFSSSKKRWARSLSPAFLKARDQSFMEAPMVGELVLAIEICEDNDIPILRKRIRFKDL